MADVDFNLKDVEAYKRRLDKFLKDKDEIAKIIIMDIAVRLVSEIIRNTPVDTGTLRMGWAVESEEIAIARQKEDVTEKMIRDNLSVEIQGKYYVIKVTNVVSYAQAVEYGHRIVGSNGVTTGWKDGVLMMTIAEGEIERVSGQIAKDNFLKIARKYGL